MNILNVVHEFHGVYLSSCKYINKEVDAKNKPPRYYHGEKKMMTPIGHDARNWTDEF
jgi:hypothetical protein